MNCIIPGANLKIMTKVLQTLTKIGDELYIEAKEDHLQFAAINQNKTAFCKFNFHSTFFTHFAIETDDKQATCKVLLKSVFNVFKSKSPKDKKVELCRIHLEDDSIIFKLKYKHDVTIVHNLRLIDKELIDVNYDVGSLQNEIGATGGLLQQILGNFQNADEDMNVEIKASNIVIRNYDLNSTNNKNIRSQIVLQSTEFLYYHIENETNVTMCFKPFRAAAHFCEGFHLNVLLNFDSGGKPVILTIRNPTFNASFILSTINPNSEVESSLSSVGERRQQEGNITVQDQEALENINWDSDFELNDVKTEQNLSVVITRNGKDEGDVEIVPNSPESPISKRMKMIFRRCFNSTFRPTQSNLGEMLAQNSDSE